MKASTSTAAIIAAIWPAATESAPRLGPDRALLDDGQVGRQRAGAQQHRQIVGRLDVKLPEIWPVPPRIGSRICGAEMTWLSRMMAKQPADILLRGLAEARRALAVETEGDDRLVGALVEGRLGVDEVLARHDDAVLDQVGNRRARRSNRAPVPGGGRESIASCTGTDWSTIWKVSCAVWPMISFSRSGSSRPGTCTRMRSSPGAG
jgi:hypothetical protein